MKLYFSELTSGVSGAGENLAGVLTRNRRQINEDLATELANSEYGQFIQEIDLDTFEAAVKEQVPSINYSKNADFNYIKPLNSVTI